MIKSIMMRLKYQRWVIYERAGLISVLVIFGFTVYVRVGKKKMLFGVVF